MPLKKKKKKLKKKGLSRRMESTANSNEALLEKLLVLSVRPSENIEGIRSAVGKICHRATTQDKQVKQKTLERIWRKEQSALPLIFSLLETVRDPLTSYNLACIIRECVSLKAGKNRNQAINQLIQLNASQILIKMVHCIHARDGVNANEALIQQFLWILSHLAQKGGHFFVTDGKFSLKTRLLGAVRTFHFYLKSFYNNSKLVFPILLIVKALARNSNTACALAKDGIVTTMEKVLTAIGFSPTSKLRVAMNIMTHLSKNKMCCTRIVESTCVNHVLRVLERWDRYDGKLKIKLCHYAVVTLQRICYLRSGRKALKSQSGLNLLYKFCQSCPDDKAFDALLTRVCGVINFCLERRSLPVDDPASPLQFPLPSVSKSYLDIFTGYSEGITEFDDLDSEDEMGEDTEEDSVSQIQGIDPDEAKILPVSAIRRSFDDLIMYGAYLDSVMPSRKNSWVDKRVEKNGRRISKLHADLKLIIPHLQADPLSIKGFTVLEKLPENPLSVLIMVSSRIRSLLPLVKIAYPELQGKGGIGLLQPLQIRDRKVCRQRVRGSVERAMNRTGSLYEVVYDLDVLAAGCHNAEHRRLGNDDERCVGEKLPYHHLSFESRFESGNLRKAVQVGLREYELILNPDVNSAHHHYWFYFQVRNMDTSAPYVFNVVNCERVNSQFNFGMKPVLYSVQESILGRPGWVRSGRDICYYRNSYQKPGGQHNCYFTATFTIDFPHDYDVCYIAYHFPYTYSHLMRRIWQWCRIAPSTNTILRAQPLCDTLNKNQVPILTLTAPDSETDPLLERQTIFLTGRVHPGESNASWILDGVIDYLVSSSTPAASTLRCKYIFIILPMLNIEGVINGCSRCGLSDEDLNRRWKTPNPTLHPEIYHAKGLLEYCCRVLHRPPALFCDFHGHSRKKNIFLYGCAGLESWTDVDRVHTSSPAEYLIPARLMAELSPAFSYDCCKWRVERGRESTARVAVWRDFGVKRSYTLEASYCGCDQGPYAGNHLDTIHLQQTGQQFCEMLGLLLDESALSLDLLSDLDTSLQDPTSKEFVDPTSNSTDSTSSDDESKDN